MIQATKQMLIRFFWGSNLESRKRLEGKCGEDVVAFALLQGYLREGEFDSERGTTICYITQKGKNLMRN